MTFGSTFGRIFSPTFQPNSQAIAGGWWLSGGIDPANCVAAYQAKGAASYAASKVNLANPGTHDAVDGSSYPTWDASDGWTGGSSRYLTTDVQPPSGDESWSMLVRFSNATPDYPDWNAHAIFISESGYSRGFGVLIASNSLRLRNGGDYNAGKPASGVAGVAGKTAYLNGSSAGTIGDGEYYRDAPMKFFVYYNNARFFNGKIQCAAVYNITLTSAQMAALSTAMAAL